MVGMPQQDAANDAFEMQRARHRANTQHQVMQQFLHDFARNMKYSVLADSAGDIPEAQRQRMMAELRPDLNARRQASGTGGADDGPTDEEIERQFPGGPGERRAAMRPRHPPHRRIRMLNAAPADAARADAAPAEEERGAEEMSAEAGGSDRARVRSQQSRRLHSDVMRRIGSCSNEACVQSVLAEAHHARQSRHHHRRQSRPADADGGEDAVLAVASRGGGGGEQDANAAPPEAAGEEQADAAAAMMSGGDAGEDAPPVKPHPKHHRLHAMLGARERVVRDALGRPMPLLFSASPPEKAAAVLSSSKPSLLLLAGPALIAIFTLLLTGSES